jgi:hypothetical protein
LTDFALVARRGGRAFFAIERFGQNTGRRSFADAAGTREQIGVADAVAFDGPLERLRHVLLANELVETLRSIPPGNDNIVSSAAGFRVAALRVCVFLGHELTSRLRLSG